MAGLTVPRDQRFLCRGILIRCFLGLKMETKHRLCFVTVFNPEIQDSFGSHAHQLLPLGVRTHAHGSLYRSKFISHVVNELGTGYECLKWIGVKSESYHQSLIQFVKFECDWKKGKSTVGLKIAQTKELSMDCRDNFPSNHPKLY